MGTMTRIGTLAFALALAGCGGDQGKAGAEPEKAPESLAPGLYEMNAEVTRLSSTDQAKPATRLKEGDRQVTRACVTSEGIPEPKLLAEEGDTCEIKNSYIRNGRMSAQMSCKREGMSGDVMPSMMGSFSADGFEGEITTLTYFIADGDYRLTRQVTAKRVGECPGGGAAPAAG